MFAITQILQRSICNFLVCYLCSTESDHLLPEWSCLIRVYIVSKYFHTSFQLNIFP